MEKSQGATYVTVGGRSVAANTPGEADSTYAWMRLAAALALSTVGGVGMWAVVVALPSLQTEFGVARSAASLPYTLTMIGFGLSGIVMGRLSDRFGILLPIVIGTLALAIGFIVASVSGSLWQFALVQGIQICVGSSTTFAPLLADTSLWFTRNRGIAVGIVASGNYLAGTIWPPVVQYFIAHAGWRHTYIGIGLFCLLAMLPLAAIAFRRKPPVVELIHSGARKQAWSDRPLGL